MKFIVCFKCPDALYEATRLIYDEGDREDAEEMARKFVKYGEEVRIEFDTEAGTALVLPR